mmetsp:Transcript_19290/g.22051  ORF Transcript_19290/g.22051 Transcript_19290/m.22051 type:complete len:235 (-) Transcript_19290:290-994(-)
MGGPHLPDRNKVVVGLQKVGCDSLHFLRKRGRAQNRSTIFLWGTFQALGNPSQLRLESKIYHRVALVDYYVLTGTERKTAIVEKLQQSSRSGHEDITLLHLLSLLFDRRTSSGQGHLDAWPSYLGCQVPNRGSRLLGQFSSWVQNQSRGPFVLAIITWCRNQSLANGKGKQQSFARSRSRRCHDIVSLLQQWDPVRLNRSGRQDALGFQSLEQTRIQGVGCFVVLEWHSVVIRR